MGGVSHPLQLTTGLVIKSVTTSPTLAGEHMLFILQVSILTEQIRVYFCEHLKFLNCSKGTCERHVKLSSRVKIFVCLWLLSEMKEKTTINNNNNNGYHSKQE